MAGGPPTCINLHKPSSSPQGSQYLIFFVTGNPGLIGYYVTFLQHLLNILSSPEFSNVEFRVYGRSLAGFEIDDKAQSQQVHRLLQKNPPYGLEDEIDYIEATLREAIRGREASGAKSPRVILIGHSVGAYIALEVLRRSRARLAGALPGEDSQEEEANGSKGPAKIVGAICLFPTVVDIAKSNSGRIFTILTALPFFPIVMGLLAYLLSLCISRSALDSLVRRITGMPKIAARTTTAWLRSRNGVRQALHMARDEMRIITSDKWDSEIWGAASPSRLGVPRAKSYFYFGKQDHWVADETRDNLIKLRSRGAENDASAEDRDRVYDWWPRMEIDGNNVPHGFCLRHSEPVAERVGAFVKDIVKTNEDKSV